jgi:hypothetical protein
MACIIIAPTKQRCLLVPVELDFSLRGTAARRRHQHHQQHQQHRQRQQKQRRRASTTQSPRSIFGCSPLQCRSVFNSPFLPASLPPCLRATSSCSRRRGPSPPAPAINTYVAAMHMCNTSPKYYARVYA